MDHRSTTHSTPSSGASSTPATSVTTGDGDARSKAESELLYRSRCFVDALNTRSFKRFNQVVGPEHVDDNFTAHLDNQASSYSWTEFVDILHNAVEADPEYSVDIINQSVDLDEVAGCATVYIFIEVTGRPKEVRREDALVFQWRKADEIWTCYNHHAIRGASGIRINDFMRER